jgi:hypothetical protein
MQAATAITLASSSMPAIRPLAALLLVPVAALLAALVPAEVVALPDPPDSLPPTVGAALIPPPPYGQANSVIPGGTKHVKPKAVPLTNATSGDTRVRLVTLEGSRRASVGG